MSGGAGTRATSTTQTGPQSWVTPSAQNYLSGVNNFVNSYMQQGYPSVLNYQGAPLQPQQQQVANLGSSFYPGLFNTAQGLYPQAQGLANQGAGVQSQFASGAMAPNNATINAYASGATMGPNPYLNQYYNQAATGLSNQYKYATQPSLQAQFQQAGAFNSPGFAEAQGQAQYGLGQGLGTLGANIYEPAYQFESGNRLAAGQSQLGGQEFGLGQQFNAAQGLSNAGAGLYAPAGAMSSLGSSALGNLYGIGSALQQQQQNALNINQTNAANAYNWPFTLLSQLGGALGQANLGGGVTTSTGPATSGGK